MEPMSHWIMPSSVARIYIYKPCQLISTYSARLMQNKAYIVALLSRLPVDTTQPTGWCVELIIHLHVMWSYKQVELYLYWRSSLHVMYSRVLLSCIMASAETDTRIPFPSPAHVAVEGLLLLWRWILNNSGQECLLGVRFVQQYLWLSSLLPFDCMLTGKE